MSVRRVGEWLSTAEGLVKAFVALVAAPAILLLATRQTFEPILEAAGLPHWVLLAIFAAAFASLGYLLWQSYAKFEVASRLEVPDAFALRSIGPNLLVGRDTYVSELAAAVKLNRLVLLDGESGCGKSALIAGGLVPLLQPGTPLLPVVIRDWGDDWERGPLAATLDALSSTLSEAERVRLGWTRPPDLTADVEALAADLDRRLGSISETLSRRPLLIADQFDDYQAQHRRLCVDDRGNWLKPDALANLNRFWRLVSTGLHDGSLHLLVVTRSDASSGLTCVRFLPERQIAARPPLPRVEVEYLRELLTKIAPADARPEIVSHPESGWIQLREQLDRDLRADGAMLMQQVRTVLLGLRQLPTLTLRAYLAAGGVRGVESLVIARALSRAGEHVQPGAAGVSVARAVLRSLVSPGTASQTPKARRASLQTIAETAGDRVRAEAIVRSLQRDEIVRPADSASDGGAWQLGHDYWARAILSEDRLANRWRTMLQDGKTRYDQARGTWRERWSALLSTRALIRVGWERARGRLSVGDAGEYVRASALRTGTLAAMVLLGAALAIAWNHDRRLTLEADSIISRFGTSRDTEAVFLVWRAPSSLKQRIYDRLRSDPARQEAAAFSRWSLAHAGVDPAKVHQAASVLRAEWGDDTLDDADLAMYRSYRTLMGRLNLPVDIEREAAELQPLLATTEGEHSVRIANIYASLVARLDHESDRHEGAAALRPLLEKSRGDEIVWPYLDVVSRLTETSDLKAEAEALRARFVPNRAQAFYLLQAYGGVLARMHPSAAADQELSIIEKSFERGPNDANDSFDYLAYVYAFLANTLDQPHLKTAASLLSSRLKRSENERMSEIYALVVAYLNDRDEIAAEAAGLRAELERERNQYRRDNLIVAYAAVAAKLSESDERKRAADQISNWLKPGRGTEWVWECEQFAVLASQLPDAKDIKKAAEILLTAARESVDSSLAVKHPWQRWPSAAEGAIAEAYASVAARLPTDDRPAAAANLREMLQQHVAGYHGNNRRQHEEDVRPFVRAYSTVAAALSPQAAENEAALMRQAFERPSDDLVDSYTALVGRLDAAGVKEEAEALVENNGRDAARDFDYARALMEVIPRLTQPFLQTAAPRLRQALTTARVSSPVANFIVDDYAEMVIRSNDATERKAGITALANKHQGAETSYATLLAHEPDASLIRKSADAVRIQFEQAWYVYTVNSLASAYGVLMGELLQREPQNRGALARDVLVVATHPYLDDPSGLLAPLGSIAKRDFDDVGSAALWVNTTFAAGR